MQVLPENLRATGYAFDKGVTGLLGALAAPLVGLLAEKVWGGRGITDNTAAAFDNSTDAAVLQASYSKNIHNARALENALLSVMIAAMGLRAIVYGFLYFTLPRDRVAAQRKDAKNEDPERSAVLSRHDSKSPAIDIERVPSCPPPSTSQQRKSPESMQRFVSLPEPLQDDK